MNPVESDSDRELRIVALEGLYAKLTTTTRRRWPVEAPLEYTGAYVSLQFAYGYARLGRIDRARALTAKAHESLALVASDVVHAWLVDAFEARIAQAIAGSPTETPLADSMCVRLAALDRVSRYKVERLREVSAIVNPTESIDPGRRYSGRHEWREFESLYALEPAERVRELGQLCNLAQTTPAGDERTRLLVGILDALFGLPEAAAIPLLLRASASVAPDEPVHHAVLYARALRVAGYFGRPDLFSDLLIGLRAAMPAASGSLAEVIHTTVRVLRRHGLRRELGELVDDLERAESERDQARTARAERAGQVTREATSTLLGELARRGDIDDRFTHHDRIDADPEPVETDRVSLAARVACAGALALIGETARAALIVDRAHARLRGQVTMPARLELTRTLAQAYANMPVEVRLREIAWLANGFDFISDAFGTNSHFALTVVSFVDALVIGIASDD